MAAIKNIDIQFVEFPIRTVNTNNKSYLLWQQLQNYTGDMSVINFIVGKKTLNPAIVRFFLRFPA
jgi:hypothetical protein